VSIFHRKLFTEAIGDELALARQARDILRTKGPVKDRQTLLSLSREYGPDLAARCYYESLECSEHGEFKRTIDAYDCDTCLNSETVERRNIDLLIIPGMFYKEYPDVGADGQLAADIAVRFGFNVKRVEVHSRGSIRKNAAVLAQTLDKIESENIWLVSLSKGSSEVQAYLNSGSMHPGLRGWINVAGINRGTPHAARKMSSLPRRLAYSVISRIIGVDYELLHELNPSHDIWNAGCQANTLQCIHVVPIPLRSHVQGMLKRRYDKLIEHGPNDGVVPVIDAQSLPGFIYPVWGVDHFMRTPKISELLYKVFTHIVRTS
jgi:hypothetical protein